MTATSFLELSDNRKIAYHLNEGKSPTVIFMGGFKSDMTGSKATTLETFCKARGQRFIRFDYRGHGESSDTFENGTIGAWAQDALDVIDQLGGDEIIIIGSSMGAWMALLTALARPEKIKAMIGIASAPDFTKTLIWETMTTEQKATLEKEGVYYAPSCYGEEPYPITYKLITEGRRHLLLSPSPLEGEGRDEGYSPHLNPPPQGGRKIGINIPIRLIHGTKDEDVPWQHSVTLMEQLESDDVQLRLIKGGDHRLSTPEYLQIITGTLEELLTSSLRA